MARHESISPPTRDRRRGGSDSLFGSKTPIVLPAVIEQGVLALADHVGDVGRNAVQVRAFLTTHLATALVARNIPEDEMRPPRADVFIPGLEALRYSNVGQEIANLIACSMDGRSADMILPAYIDMLKQLSPDEIEILRNLAPLGRFVAIADLVFSLPNGQVIMAHRHLLPASLADVCQTPANIPQYVDNLMRLNLVYCPLGEQADEASYAGLARLAFLAQIKRQTPKRAKAGMDHHALGVTDLGESFRAACFS